MSDNTAQIARRIAEVKERILDQARVDAACDSPPDATDDEILAMAEELADARARAIVAEDLRKLACP